MHAGCASGPLGDVVTWRYRLVTRTSHECATLAVPRRTLREPEHVLRTEPRRKRTAQSRAVRSCHVPTCFCQRDLAEAKLTNARASAIVGSMNLKLPRQSATGRRLPRFRTSLPAHSTNLRTPHPHQARTQSRRERAARPPQRQRGPSPASCAAKDPFGTSRERPE